MEFKIRRAHYRRIVSARHGFFRYENLTQHYYDTCLAVEIHTTNKRRRLKYAQRRTDISAECKGSVFILIHDHGKTYFYNLFGEMVFPALPNPEFKHKEVLHKVDRLQEESQELNFGRYRTKVKKHLVRRWKTDPEPFEKEGRMIIIQGEWEKTLDVDGFLCFEFYEKKKRKYGIDVGDGHHKKPVTVEFRGPFALMHFQDSIINAYHTSHVGFECKRLSPVPAQMEYLRMKNVNWDVREQCFRTPSRIYIFKTSDLEEIAQSEQCALLCHSRRMNDRFSLYCCKDGVIDSQAVYPKVRARPKKKEFD